MEQRIDVMRERLMRRTRAVSSRLEVILRAVSSRLEVIFWRTPSAPPIACWPAVGMRGGNAPERGDEFKTAFMVLFELIARLPGPSNQG